MRATYLRYVVQDEFGAVVLILIGILNFVVVDVADFVVGVHAMVDTISITGAAHDFCFASSQKY